MTVGAVDLAAETEMLAGLLAVELSPDWRDTLARFAQDTRTYAEFQIALDPGRVSLVTMGSGDDHLERVASHLRRMDLGDDGARTFADLREAVPGATWGVKVDLSGGPALQVYVKRPIPVGEVQGWLQRRGVEPSALDVLARVADALGRSYTHFVGVGLAPGASPVFVAYFTQYVDGGDDVADRIGTVMTLVDVPADHRADLAVGHPWLARTGQSVWLSVAVSDGALHRSVKLDYSGVDLDDVVRLAVRIRASDDARERLDRVRATLGARHASYLGWRIQERPVLSLYFTRTKRSLRTGG